MRLPLIGTLANTRDFASAVYEGSQEFFRKKDARLEPGGAGPYGPASYLTHPSLPGHTIYAPDPRALAEGERLPVLVWANGMGLAWGLMFGAFLREIASHGYVVIASGAPGDEGVWTAAGWARLRMVGAGAMEEAVRWAVRAGQGGEGQGHGGGAAGWDVRAHVDGTRIALGGQSKGGLDAYETAAALRRAATEEGGDGARAAAAAAARDAVRTVMLFNSGLIGRSAAQAAQVTGLAVPVLYIAGGPADVAHANAERDWAELVPRALPAWKGVLGEVGHMGTFYRRDDVYPEGQGTNGLGQRRSSSGGGKFVGPTLHWLGMVLKGDEEARRRLREAEGFEREGWAVESRNL